MKPRTERLIATANLGVLKEQYPRVGDLLMSLRIDVYDEDLPLVENLGHMAERYFEDFGTTRAGFVEDVAAIVEGAMGDGAPAAMRLESIEVLGGRDKDGAPEAQGVVLRRGEVVGIVGRTGAGKSRLLADIECLAQADTPSGRTVLVDGAVPGDELRMSTDNRLVAQLSQNMNFIMDHTVERFLRIHAACRGGVGETGEEGGGDGAPTVGGVAGANVDELIGRVFAYANTLAGEHFSLDTPVTQLSGGQSRALMIADTLLLSESPIILIDEIENAGIDRKKAVELLARTDKIVLISTHDPLLALSCDRRLVICNGGIARVIEVGPAERRNRAVLDAYDKRMMALRERLRDGELIEEDLAGCFS